MTVDFTLFSKKTKAILVAAISAASVVQVSTVRNDLLPLIDHHPHLVSIFGTIVFCIGVIQNPIAQKLIHQFEAEQTESKPDGSQVVSKVSETTVAPADAASTNVTK
jgi:hypothetical protein